MIDKLRTFWHYLHPCLCSVIPLNRRFSWVEWLLFGSAVVSALVVCVLFGFLLYFTLPLFFEGEAVELFSPHWRPFHDEFGILPMVVGSVLLALCALCVAYPISLGICLFIHGLGPRKLGKFVLLVIHFMTGIPTVVYGFIAALLLVPLLRNTFVSGSGYSLLAATLTLSVLLVPTIVLLIHGHLQQIAPTLRLTATSLGISRIDELIHITLPAASYSLFAAAVLGFGRAVGDTLIALMVAGNAAQFPDSVFDSIRTLTAHIALVVATDSQSSLYHSLFASGVILFLTTTAVNITLSRLRCKFADGALND